mmetsp:Transcript_57118/g.64718  ORF Transcript_57118/g.64718 Transcript_57118/m.64718 type:complete len:293 (+) Transcript_57118:54-932(+)
MMAVATSAAVTRIPNNPWTTTGTTTILHDLVRRRTQQQQQQQQQRRRSTTGTLLLFGQQRVNIVGTGGQRLIVPTRQRQHTKKSPYQQYPNIHHSIRSPAKKVVEAEGIATTAVVVAYDDDDEDANASNYGTISRTAVRVITTLRGGGGEQQLKILDNGIQYLKQWVAKTMLFAALTVLLFDALTIPKSVPLPIVIYIFCSLLYDLVQTFEAYDGLLFLYCLVKYISLLPKLRRIQKRKKLQKIHKKEQENEKDDDDDGTSIMHDYEYEEDEDWKDNYYFFFIFMCMVYIHE